MVAHLMVLIDTQLKRNLEADVVMTEWDGGSVRIVGRLGTGLNVSSKRWRTASVDGHLAWGVSVAKDGEEAREVGALEVSGGTETSEERLVATLNVVALEEEHEGSTEIVVTLATGDVN